jgi:DNA-directed RNA polymerase specialized sigma24 family protein
MEPSDEALVQACRSGDATAWAMLVDRYQRLVYSIARRAGLDQEESADVFQLVFATLVEHLGQIEQPALIGAWLVTTTRHEAWRSRPAHSQPAEQGVATFRVDIAVARDQAGATDERTSPQWLHAPDERDHLLFDRLLGITARLSPRPL